MPNQDSRRTPLRPDENFWYPNRFRVKFTQSIFSRLKNPTLNIKNFRSDSLKTLLLKIDFDSHRTTWESYRANGIPVYRRERTQWEVLPSPRFAASNMGNANLTIMRFFYYILKPSRLGNLIPGTSMAHGSALNLPVKHPDIRLKPYSLLCRSTVSHNRDEHGSTPGGSRGGGWGIKSIFENHFKRFADKFFSKVSSVKKG